jgi:hypothetical protein
MPDASAFQDIPLPKSWNTRVKSGVLQAIALAHTAMTFVRGMCADSSLARVRLKAELDRRDQEIALVREQLRLLAARFGRIPGNKRPHYHLLVPGAGGAGARGRAEVRRPGSAGIPTECRRYSTSRHKVQREGQSPAQLKGLANSDLRTRAGEGAFGAIFAVRKPRKASLTVQESLGPRSTSGAQGREALSCTRLPGCCPGLARRPGHSGSRRSTHGAKVTSDAGLPACRELDEVQEGWHGKCRLHTPAEPRAGRRGRPHGFAVKAGLMRTRIRRGNKCGAVGRVMDLSRDRSGLRRDPRACYAARETVLADLGGPA